MCIDRQQTHRRDCDTMSFSHRGVNWKFFGQKRSSMTIHSNLLLLLTKIFLLMKQIWIPILNEDHEEYCS